MNRQFEYEFIVSGDLSDDQIGWLSKVIRSSAKSIGAEVRGMFGQEAVYDDGEYSLEGKSND